MKVDLGPAQVVTHLDDHILVSAPDGQIRPEDRQGFLAADTRFLSRYRLQLDGSDPLLLNSGTVSAYGVRFELTNPALQDGAVPERTLHLQVDRSVGRGVHEDLDLTNHGCEGVSLSVQVEVACDFADIFEMKDGRSEPRGQITSQWDPEAQSLTISYRNGDFARAFNLRVARSDGDVEFTDGILRLAVDLRRGESWHTCLFWVPQVRPDERQKEPLRSCSELGGADSELDRLQQQWVESSSSFDTADPVISQIVTQAVADLSDLRLHVNSTSAMIDEADPELDQQESWIPAAGVPWFVTLFGRDSMLVSLLSLSLTPVFASGSLRLFGQRQAESRDDRHDAEPGKIIHELRRGELAHLGSIPQTPYYGTHDAPALYVLTAAESWRWQGDRQLLDEVRPHVERALHWIDTDGDRDGDGLQEYATRAGDWGYYNQSWKDSGEAIVDRDGGLSGLPIATCELQGYVVAAKRAWADALESAYGEHRQAEGLRGQADALADRLEERFWWADEGTYYLGLDGNKQPIETVASNPGHLLWCGAIEPDRAESVGRRLLADDMWSGWGIRTLSAQHRAYNPFSYQRGSVWPHDNAMTATGLRGYGHHSSADRIARALFDAGALFSEHHLPELFAGLQRDEHSFPVQYPDANVPQAWAAGAVVELLAAMLGFEPDARQHRLTLRPALPEWLPRLTIERLRVGDATVSLKVTRKGSSHHLDVEVTGGELAVELGAEPHR